MTRHRRHTYGTAARRRNRVARWPAVVIGAVCAGMVGACTPTYDYRGFVAQEETLDQIHIGMPRTEVEQILGTPSAKSDVAGTRYYYISSTFETVAFFEPEEIDRKVYAVEFDDTDSVSRVAYYGLKDGKIFDFVSRKTPTRGKELTLVQEFFGNIGRFDSGRSLVKEQISRH